VGFKPHQLPWGFPGTQAKKDMDAYLVAQAKQVDDPWLLLLETAYKGQVCFVHDIAARHKLYRVARISFWPSTKYEYANWEATLEPIHLAPDGSCFVHADDSVIGPNGNKITKAKSYLGFIVAQYIDGDDKDPERIQCVDEYMSDALENFSRLEAKRANNSAALPQTTSDRPTARMHHIPEEITMMGSPSSPCPFVRALWSAWLYLRNA
jgi:hypothetical protein